MRHLNATLNTRHDHAQAYYYLGLSHLNQNCFEDAADCFLMATHFRPDFPEALHQLGLVARRRRDYDQAVVYFEKAIELNPNFAYARNNLGYTLFNELGEHERGAAHIEAALRLRPQDPDIRCNYSMVLVHRGLLDAALAQCDELLAAHPDLHEARLNRALAALKLGRFAEAWPDYEARKCAYGNYVARDFGFPEWRGEPLAGKSVLVYAEQGVGDQIMFASCLPDLLQHAGRCVVECSPQLEKLFRRSFPRATVCVGDPTSRDSSWISRLGAIDYQIAIGSLPLHFRSDLSRFPHHAGYLQTDPERCAYWRQRLDALGAGYKIGISWHGGAVSTRRALRSIPLQQWLPLVSQASCHFVSLQYGDNGGESGRFAHEHGVHIHHWQQAIDDYDETAALVSALDLVISVQTAVVHLSGALGKPAWVLVPTIAEWRYLQEGDTMPWYPSVRLFRQQLLGAWRPLITEIAQRLSTRV
jgi:tetratricopeptide (TPR) repeat protein